MVEVNSMYQPRMRNDDIKAQIDTLEGLAHVTAVHPTFDAFDDETEAILTRIFGASHPYVESYKYATLGEAEALTGEDHEDPPGPS